MAGRVFISCGQRGPEEREVAAAVKQWFADAGFAPYAAIQAQSLADVNSGILDQLRRSDYYVFIDFRRDQLDQLEAEPAAYRGSLFTHQELAVAHLLGFEHAIFLQEAGVRCEGLLQYMASNAQRFVRREEVLGLVKGLVRERGWDPAYSRHLVLGQAKWTPPLRYGDHTGTKHVRVFEVDVHNRRSDLGALGAIARLKEIRGASLGWLDHSPLKVGGQPGYSQTIWPQSHGAWDLMAVHLDAPANISLNSALDVPRSPIVSKAGRYSLAFEVFSPGFPLLSFEIELTLTVNWQAGATGVTACCDGREYGFSFGHNCAATSGALSDEGIAT